MGKVAVLACGLLVSASLPAEAQKERRAALIAKMTAMMEFMCLKRFPDEAPRERCLVEQGEALSQILRLVEGPNPAERARASELIQLCSKDTVTQFGVDNVATLACFNKARPKR